MSTFHEEDLEIQSLMNEAPLTSETPKDLRARLLAKAATVPVRRPMSTIWQTRLAMAGGLAVAIIAAAVYMAPPLKAAAKTFQRLVSAVDQTNSFQLTVSSNESGKAEHMAMVVSENGFSMRVDDGTMIRMNGTKFEIYDPKENVVTALNLGGMINPKDLAREMKKGLDDGFDHMDLKKMLKDLEKEYGKENIHVSPIYQRAGKSTYEITLEKPGEPERVHITANAETDLPERIVVSKNGKDDIVEIQFGGPIRAEMENFQFPANAKRVDLDISKMMQDGFKGFGDGFKGFENGFKGLGEGFKGFEGIEKLHKQPAK